MFSLKQVLFVSLPHMSIGTIPAISIGTGTATARVPISNRDRAYTADHTSNPVSSSTQPLRCSDQNNTLAISPDQTLGGCLLDTPRGSILVNDKSAGNSMGLSRPARSSSAPTVRVFTSAIVLLDLLQYSMVTW